MYLALACTDLSVSGFSIKTLFSKFSQIFHFLTLFFTSRHFPALFGTQPTDATSPKPKKQPKTSFPHGNFASVVLLHIDALQAVQDIKCNS
jgi:hypothetical protein